MFNVSDSELKDVVGRVTIVLEWDHVHSTRRRRLLMLAQSAITATLGEIAGRSAEGVGSILFDDEGGRSHERGRTQRRMSKKKEIKDENVAQFVDGQLIKKEHTLPRRSSSTTSRTRVSWRTTTTSATVPVSLAGSKVRPWAL